MDLKIFLQNENKGYMLTDYFFEHLGMFIVIN